MYSEKVMDHFNNPRNVGEIENPSGVGTVGNAKCGDIMRMYLDIDENQLKISFGFEFVDDNFDELQNVLNRAKEKFDLKLDWTNVVESEHGVNTKEEIDYTVDELKKIIERLRSMSPLYEDFVKKQSA